MSLEQQVNNLNKEQKLAVETIEGPVLIVAGPGTGKTQVLALRIANILQKTDAEPSNILCLTFTESAVKAMRERLIKIIGAPAYQIKIHTYHSFSNEIIQNFPEKFAFAKELNQIDDISKIKLIDQTIESFKDDDRIKVLRPFYNPFAYRNSILDAISTLKKESIDPLRFEMIVKDSLREFESNVELNKKNKPTSKYLDKVKNAEKNLELALIYGRYQELLVEKGFYDYEDMLMFVVEKFKIDEELLSYYQEKFLYILLDEYQDTNGVQNEIIKYLGSFDRSPNIFAVGDDDQAIYRFQGANLENLLFFERQFTDVKTIFITTNYRSSQTILDIADSVIENNKTRLVSVFPNLEKKLKSGLDVENKKGEIYKFQNGELENHFIIKKIKDLKENGVNYSEIAIFYRNHSNAVELIEALLKEGIPINVNIGKNAIDNKYVAHFVDLLRLATLEGADLDNLVIRSLFFPFVKIDRSDLYKLMTYLNREKIFYRAEGTFSSLFEIIDDSEKISTLNLKYPQKIIDFKNKIIEWKSLIETSNLLTIAERIGEESGLIEYVYSEDKGIENINSISSFFNFIKNTELNNREIRLVEFLNDINILKDNRIEIPITNYQGGEEGVNLMTAHRSKGLEFEHVFIIKCTEKVWGKQRARGGTNIKLPSFSENANKLLGEDFDYEVEDQRRLFFVAITRAKQHIYFTLSSEYSDSKGSSEHTPSKFLAEIDPRLVVEKEAEMSSTELISAEELKKQVLPIKVTNSDEDKYLKKIVEDFKLSASALNEYIECPRKFKFNTLLKVPKKYNKELVLGSALHRALELFFRELKNGNKKDIEYLLFVFEKALERELITKIDFQEVLVEGKGILEKYYEEYSDKFIKPIELEYRFNGNNVVLHKDGFEPIKITGRIDKIEEIESDDKFGPVKIRVIDYKKSSPKSENEIMGKTKSSTPNIYRQLMFYKILGECDPNFRPKNSLHKYEVAEYEIDFLKSNKGKFVKRRLPVIEEDVNDFKGLIFEVMEKIRRLEFEGSKDYPLCEECEWCRF